MDDYFPKPERVIIGCKRLDEKSAKYSDRRYGDTLEIEGKPIGTISKIGRKFWTRELEFGKLSYQYCGSFPLKYIFIGNLQDVKNRIGNSVPPLFMRSIARQIKFARFNGEKPNVTLKRIDDYPAYLEAAWQEHLQPKPDNAPTVISLFAGCGGSSLGYSMAGFRELLAVEWDDNAVETFKLNFPDVPVYHGDIAKISVDECLQMTGLKIGELDILDGSPPCQGFSTAGKRQLDDPRNQLFREYVRLLRGLRPKVFVMENVGGMVKGIMKLVFVEILKELKASGYKVSARLLNAMYFGVPQSRQRVIFIGVREDLGIEPSHPEAENLPIPVKNVLPGCLATRSQDINPYISSDKPAATICKTSSGYSVLRDSFTIPKSYTEWSSKLKPGQTVSDIHPKRFGFNMIKLDNNKPSPTVTKTHTPAVGLLHPDIDRFLTISEVKLLSSFPDGFFFIGGTTEFNQRSLAWMRIGNSVPPLFMRSIANCIRQEILSYCENAATK